MDQGRFSCPVSRRYLTTLFLIKVNEMKLSTAQVMRLSGICRTTFNNIKRGGVPSLGVLRCLFAIPFDSPLLTPDQAGMAVSRIIADSLPDTTCYPRLRVVSIPVGHSCDPPVSLPAYMKCLRTDYLGISKREVCRRFDYCDSRQLSAIENDCFGVGIGPICYLFNNYFTSIPELPIEEWGTFATLVLYWLFPTIKGYKMELDVF